MCLVLMYEWINESMYVCMYVFVCVDIVRRKVRYPSTLQATKAYKKYSQLINH